MKMFTWSQKPFFLATAHAESVAEARRLLVETQELGESGDGSCPEHDRARRIILEMNPNIWTGANAEFALTDSAEVKEYQHNFRIMGEEIKQLKARAEAAEQSLAAVREENADLTRSLSASEANEHALEKVRDSLRSQLTAAQEDRERMDWLAEERSMQQLEHIWVHSDPTPDKFRAAIDAARSQKGGPDAKR